MVYRVSEDESYLPTDTEISSHCQGTILGTYSAMLRFGQILDAQKPNNTNLVE